MASRINGHQQLRHAAVDLDACVLIAAEDLAARCHRCERLLVGLPDDERLECLVLRHAGERQHHGKVMVDMPSAIGRMVVMAFALPAALRANRVLAVRFYNAGPGRTKTDLAAVISNAVERKELVVDSAELAAYDLISLWEGGLPGRIAFGLAESETPEEAAQRAKRGTDVFLRAYASPRKRRI
jgi:AefR-like transcriptional repressor, C-terminal domain